MSVARAARRFVPVLAVVLGLCGALGATAASAHADLADASPRAGAVLEGPPTEIVLDFDAAVEQGLAQVELLRANGEPVVLDALVDTPDDSQLVAPVHSPEDLGAGVYVVRYRVTTVDSHVQQDAFTFQIGRAAADQQQVLAQVGAPGSSVGLGWFAGVLRVLAFVGLALLLGSWSVTALDAGTRRSPAAAPGWVGIALLAVSTVLLIAVHGAQSSGGGFGALGDVSAWGDVVGARFGTALVVRLVLAALAALVVGGASIAGRAAWRMSAALVAVCVTVTFGLAGHAGVDRLPALGLLLDAVHLLSSALWVGAVLVLLVGRRQWLAAGTEGRSAVATRVVRSLPCWLAVLVVTGVLQTWRVVRQASAFGGSAYGNLLIGKAVACAVIALVLVVGWSASRRTGVAVVSRLLAAQVVVGVVVLGCSAALVAHSPDAPVRIVPATVSASEGGVGVSITVTPARVGSNDFHVLVEQQGSVTPSAEARLSISRPDAGIGEVSVPLAPDGPDHYSAFGVRIPTAGTWQVVIEVDSADGATTTLTTSVRIAG